MNLSQFAEGHGIKINALSNYISRHPEIQEHIKKEGKNTELLPEAVRLLEAVYPIPKPVQVVQGVPREEHDLLQKKYDAVMEKLARIQEERIEEHKKYALLEASQSLLEVKTEELDKTKKVLLYTENMLKESEDELKRTDNAAKYLQQRLDEEKSEVKRLKERSLWQRIRNT